MNAAPANSAPTAFAPSLRANSAVPIPDKSTCSAMTRSIENGSRSAATSHSGG